jgi:L-asparaginase
MGTSPDEEVELLAQIDDNLRRHPLSGIVVEGTSPHGKTGQTAQTALRRAIYLGMPVVSVGRGNPGGFVTRDRLRLGIAGQNLTATKARLLLMASLLKLGMLPPAADPDHPTPDEVAATNKALTAYQAIFDTH